MLNAYSPSLLHKLPRTTHVGRQCALVGPVSREPGASTMWNFTSGVGTTLCAISSEKVGHTRPLLWQLWPMPLASMAGMIGGVPIVVGHGPDAMYDGWMGK